MSLQSWWQQKSRRAKTITILATLLLLEIGLCFGTPVGVSWSDTAFGTHFGRDPFASLGYMFIQAIVAGITLLIFLGAVIFYRPSSGKSSAISIAATQNGENSGNNEDR
jgi:hypothetical protein